MPGAKELLVPKGIKKYPREKEYYFDDLEIDAEPITKGSRVEFYWEQGQEIWRAEPLKKEQIVILQPDEVRVLGQNDIDSDSDNALETARQEVWIYPAVVSEGEKNYYFSAD